MASMPGLPVLHQIPGFTPTHESVIPSNHLIPGRPLLLPLQSFTASGSFQMSQLFTSGGQSLGVSASASVLPMNIQDWFPLGRTGWLSLQSKGQRSLVSCKESDARLSTPTHWAIWVVPNLQPGWPWGNLKWKWKSLSRVWLFVTPWTV